MINYSEIKIKKLQFLNQRYSASQKNLNYLTMASQINSQSLEFICEAIYRPPENIIEICYRKMFSLRIWENVFFKPNKLCITVFSNTMNDLESNLNEFWKICFWSAFLCPRLYILIEHCCGKEWIDEWSGFRKQRNTFHQYRIVYRNRFYYWEEDGEHICWLPPQHPRALVATAATAAPAPATHAAAAEKVEKGARRARSPPARSRSRSPSDEGEDSDEDEDEDEDDGEDVEDVEEGELPAETKRPSRKPDTNRGDRVQRGPPERGNRKGYSFLHFYYTPRIIFLFLIVWIWN